MARPSMPDVALDAAPIVKAHKVTKLLRAIGLVERVSVVDIAVLKMLGAGTSSGTALSECTTAKEKADSRKEIVAALLAADPGLLAKLGGDESDESVRGEVAAKAAARLVAAVVEAATAGAGTGGDDPHSVTNYVVTQTEEERGYTVPSYDADDVRRQKAVIDKMHNLKMRPHELPTLGQLKKIRYWVVNETATADPTRVPLTGMRRDPRDSAYTCIKRYVLGHVLCAAGESAAAGLRDEGAGDLLKFGTQWLNADKAVELLQELDEVRDHITDPEMMAAGAVMVETMHKATLRAKETASLAVARQISKVPEYVAQARGAKGGGGGAEREKTPRGGARRKRKRAEVEAEAAPAAPTPPGSGKGGGRFPDEDGAKGPNGLPRMKGGNPAGSKCKLHPKCTFKFCSFSHAK